jgi:glycosyltransferase involved in cell wall biosynthesis
MSLNGCEASTEQYPFVSVIMPVRNEVDYIERAINSVRRNNYQYGRIEIIVVDGMSDDGTREIIHKLAHEDSRIVVFDNIKQIVPTAMNIGLNAMRGEIFIRVDGHAEIPDDYIASCISCLKEHSDAWVVGGCIETISDSFVGAAIAAAMSSPIGVGMSRFRLGNYDGWIDTVAFGAHHAWVPRRVGYFDEDLVRNQDDEFNLRIRLAGGKLWLSKKIKSSYYSRSSLAKLWKQYRQYGFWRVRIIQKHRNIASLRQAVPLAFVTISVFLAAGALVSPVIKSLLYAEVVIYLFLLLLGMAGVARKNGFVNAVLSPVVFVILHAAYGLGSLIGVVHFFILRRSGICSVSNNTINR